MKGRVTPAGQPIAAETTGGGRAVPDKASEPDPFEWDKLRAEALKGSLNRDCPPNLSVHCADTDAPTCGECGSIVVGSKCSNCGAAWAGPPPAPAKAVDSCGQPYSRATRVRLPDERWGTTLCIRFPRHGEEDLKCYVTANSYPGTRRCAEVFVRADKEGQFASAALNALAQTISVALQFGVPLKAITSKLVGMQSEPSGFTRNEEFPVARSPFDLIGRWLEVRFDTAEPA